MPAQKKRPAAFATGRVHPCARPGERAPRPRTAVTPPVPCCICRTIDRPAVTTAASTRPARRSSSGFRRFHASRPTTSATCPRARARRLCTGSGGKQEPDHHQHDERLQLHSDPPEKKKGGVRYAPLFEIDVTKFLLRRDCTWPRRAECELAHARRRSITRPTSDLPSAGRRSETGGTGALLRSERISSVIPE